MKKRFKINQKVWTPYNNVALRVDIIDITYDEFFIEYEIQTFNELGHQSFETHLETKENTCLLFESKEKCDEYIERKEKKTIFEKTKQNNNETFKQ